MKHGFNSGTGQRLNAQLILNLLVKHQANTRIELSRITGLTQATISNIVNPLIEIGLLYEYPIVSGSVGRRSLGLAVNYDRFSIIHLRIISGKFSIGNFNLAGKQIQSYSEQYPLETDPMDIMLKIYDYIEKTLANEEGVAVLGVGISLPSPYVNGSYFEHFSELKNWNNINICQLIHDKFNLPAYAENDSNVGALNEWQNDPSIGDSDTLVYVSLSSGTSCGIISNGQLLRGNQGLAGEIGHMTVDINGPRCICGKRGCLELYTSVSAMKQAARKASASFGKTTLTPSSSKSDLFKAIKNNDELALKIFNEAMGYLSVGIMNLVFTYNPRIIVFGDEMVMQGVGPKILEYLQTKLKENIRPELFDNLTLKLSSDLSDPAFTGSGVLVRNHMYDILVDYHIL